ncbi:hypothetical protein Tdes44962_MAKER08154 [Teratosphaeria destructans]|uniref:Uncharacterized protein n=1 Tax=Teratosphaeria destructans TaxID=418781 RepID=A0A9W7SXF3_9PEZI|nr:hypothetical protein Tdes44962_MAKER08154 [Teratosphaeria destructans]
MAPTSKASQDRRDRVNQILKRHGYKPSQPHKDVSSLTRACIFGDDPNRQQKTSVAPAAATAKRDGKTTKDVQQAQDPVRSLATSVEREILRVFEMYPQHFGTVNVVADTLKHILEAIAELRELGNVLVKLFVHAVSQVVVSRGTIGQVFAVQNLRLKICDTVSSIIERQQWEKAIILAGSTAPRALIRSQEHINVFNAILTGLRGVVRKLDGFLHDAGNYGLSPFKSPSAMEAMLKKGMAAHEKAWNSTWHYHRGLDHQDEDAAPSSESRSQSLDGPLLEAPAHLAPPPTEIVSKKRKAMPPPAQNPQGPLASTDMPPPKKSRRLFQGGGVKWTDAETLALLKLSNSEEYQKSGAAARAALHKQWTDENEPAQGKNRSGDAIGQHMKKLKSDGVTIESLEAKLAAARTSGAVTGLQNAARSDVPSPDRSNQHDARVIPDSQEEEDPAEVMREKTKSVMDGKA